MRHYAFSKNSSKIPITDDRVFIKEWVAAPLKRKLPKILETLDSNPEMQVMFIPAHYVIRVIPGKTGQEHADELQAHKMRFKNYIDMYNDCVSEIVTSANHPRLIWLEVLKKITVSPTGFPLTPDGTHLNWARSRDMEKQHEHNETLMKSIPMADSHKAILDVILNLHCREQIPEDVENLCCA